MTLHDTNVNDNICGISLCTLATTSSERRAQFSDSLVILISSTHMHRGSRCLRHSHHPHGHPRACDLLGLTFLLYLLLFLPHLGLTYTKFMANLHNSAKEGVDTTDVLSFSTQSVPVVDELLHCLIFVSILLNCCLSMWRPHRRSRLWYFVLQVSMASRTGSYLVIASGWRRDGFATVL